MTPPACLIAALVVAVGLQFGLAEPSAAQTSTEDPPTCPAGQAVRHRSRFEGTACDSSSSGGSGGGSGPSMADRWAMYCSNYGNYRAGHEVSLIQGRQVTGTTVLFDLGFGGYAGSFDTEQITFPVDGPAMYEYRIGCRTPTGLNLRNEILPSGSGVAPFDLRTQVRAALTIPDPQPAGSPPLDDPDRFSVVRIPTWLWLDQPLDPLTDSASAGGISVSVTATPTGVTWHTGDREHETCPVEQIAWRPNMNEGDTNCSHTYTRSSAGEPDDAYELTAVVHWELSWTLNGAEQGVFDTHDTTTTLSHQVGEILAVNRSYQHP